MSMIRVFCYGTLKQGFSAHGLMSGANFNTKFIGAARTTNAYQLLDMGGFPGMVPSEHGTGVSGEVYEVSEVTKMRLDRYECVDSGLFRFEEVELEDGTKANAYLFNRYDERESHTTGRGRKIPSGVWE